MYFYILCWAQINGFKFCTSPPKQIMILFSWFMLIFNITFKQTLFLNYIFLGSQSSAKPPDKITETIKLWRKRSWTVDELEGHEDRILDCDVNIQHNMILTSSCDTTVKVCFVILLEKSLNFFMYNSQQFSVKDF